MSESSEFLPTPTAEAPEPRGRGASFLIAVLIFIAMLATPAPYVRAEPGGTYDALGAVQDEPLVEIEKVSQYPQFPTSGQLRLLTVWEWGGPIGPLALGDALRVVIDDAIVLQKVEFLYPDPVDSGEIEKESAFQFADAESQAVAAALRQLDIPVTSRVSILNVDAKGPAAKQLKSGDQVLAIGSEPVADLEQVAKVMSAYQPGDFVSLEIIRDGKPMTREIKLGSNDEGKARIGIEIRVDFEGPMDIKVQLNNVGGPSAGLAFALAIYDKLTPGELLRGRTIALTGTIDENGKVGPIGGLHQKLASAARAGARLMLIPAANCASVEGDVPPELRVVPVATLADAVAALETKDPTSLPSCPLN